MTAYVFRLLVQKPKLCFGLLLTAHTILIITTAGLYFSGYDILPADFTQVPLNLEKDERKLRADAWKFVRQDPTVTLNPLVVGKQRERSSRRDVLEIVYEERDGNVFSRRNLREINRTEKELFGNKIYRSKLCLMEGNGKCRLPMSILRFFDGSLKSIHPVFEDHEFKNIHEVLMTAKKNSNFTKTLLDFHLPKDAVIVENKAKAHYTRTLFFIGYPLKGFSNTEDRPDEQWDKIQEFARIAFAKNLDNKYKDGVGSMRLYYFLRALFFNSISEQVIYDLLLAGASFTFIFLFMLFQTHSLWITGWAVFSILSCFFGANFVYRMILDCRYIGIFHVLSVFIILGIGADDVFVFLDTWRGSDERGFPNLAAKLSFVYRRAASAMFITSITTMVAFTTSVFSPLLGVSTFGIFSALLVFVNFCSVVTFFPTVVVTYELYWKDFRWNCFTISGWTEKESEENQLEIETIEQEPHWTEKFQQPHKHAVKFLGGAFYHKVVGHKVVRWVILSFFTIIISLSVFYAMKLTPDEDQVAVWGKGTNWYSIRKLRQLVFRPSQEDKVIKVNLIWGLKPQNRDSCHYTDYKCKGKTVFDQSFDLNPPPCQMAILDFCREIRQMSRAQVDKLRIRRNAVTGEIEAHCFAEKMNNFLKVEASKTLYPNNTVFTMPITSEKTKTLMRRHPNLYEISKLTDTYYRYYEVMMGFWLTDGNKTYSSHDYITYSRLLGGAMDKTETATKPNFEGNRFGNRLLFASIEINTTMVPTRIGHVEGLAIYDHWEKFMNKKMKTMPSSCRNGFQATPSAHNAWHWMKVQEILASTAVRGILMSLGLAVGLLTLMTTNWIVGLMAGATIACITVGVVGFIPLMGWKLGVLESLNLTLVVGLAVDYVVHLADGYVRSSFHSRQEKIRDALGSVGISVLSGASTTLGASVFMLAAKIVFFFQFGIFMFVTIGLSILYALFFFTTLLALLGPNGKTGSILTIWRFFKKMFCEVREEKETPHLCERCGNRIPKSPDKILYGTTTYTSAV